MIEDLAASCPRTDWSVQIGASVSTLLAWTPAYDRSGNLTGSDPNKTTRQPRCITCGRSWTVTTQAGRPDTITEDLQPT